MTTNAIHTENGQFDNYNSEQNFMNLKEKKTATNSVMESMFYDGVNGVILNIPTMPCHALLLLQ